MRKHQKSEASEDTSAAVEESDVPIFKQFEIKESTIPGAGEGFF